MVPDAELLCCYACKHSDRAFTELVERHLPVVYNAALRRVNGDAHPADEACQLVFTQLARKAARLQHHPTLLGWLHTSTRYAASALHRREQRRALRERLAATMHLPADETSPVSWEQLRPMIDDALDALNPADRQAILLRFFTGRSFAEIGAELGVSGDASRKRVERALESLRRRFIRSGITTSTAALALVLAQAPAFAAPPTLVASTIASAATISSGTSLGAGVVGLISIMKASSITTALSVVGVAAFGTALYTWSEQQERTRSQLAAIDAQASAFHLRLQSRAKTASPPAAAAQTPSQRAANAPANQTRSAFVEEQLRTAKRLESSPDYARLHREETRLRVENEFGPFLASRIYAPEQTRAAREALVEMYLAREQEWAAFGRAPADNRVKPDVATAARVEKILADLRPQLPDADIEQLKRGFNASNWMKPTRDVAADFADAGVPMPRMHEQALAAVMADADVARKDPARQAQSVALDPSTGLTGSERAQLDDTAAFLTPEQLSLFERYLSMERERGALTKRAANQSS